jgi:hypothetical protein
MRQPEILEAILVIIRNAIDRLVAASHIPYPDAKEGSNPGPGKKIALPVPANLYGFSFVRH